MICKGGEEKKERERGGEKKATLEAVSGQEGRRARMGLISDCLRLSADGVDVRGAMLRSLSLLSKCFLCESAPCSASAGLCPHHDHTLWQHAEAECNCEVCLFSN